MDWAYVVDSSDSVDWNSWRSYVSENAQRYFKVSDEMYRVGLITYSDGARIAFPFNTAERWDLLIDRTPQQGGSGRRIDLALQRARDELFTPRLGAREGVRKVHVYHVILYYSTLERNTFIYIYLYIYIYIYYLFICLLLLLFVYVITWARGQLKFNFTPIFKVFTKLPESRSEDGNLENFENTSENNL